MFVLIAAFATAGINIIKDGTTQLRYVYIKNKPVSATKTLFEIHLVIVVVIVLLLVIVIDRFPEANHAAGIVSDI